MLSTQTARPTHPIGCLERVHFQHKLVEHQDSILFREMATWLRNEITKIHLLRIPSASPHAQFNWPRGHLDVERQLQHERKLAG